MLFNKFINQSIRRTYKYESLAGVSFAVYNTFVIMFTPIIMRRLGADDFWMGVLMAAPVAGALFIFFWLNLGFKMEKFKFITITKGISRLILIIPILLNNYILFIAFYFLSHIMEKGTSPTYTGIMKDIYPVQHRGRAMGMVRMEVTIMSIILFVIAGKLFDILDYRILFTIGIIFGIVAQIIFYSIKRTVDSKPVEKRKFILADILKILREDKFISKYFAIFFLLGFSNILGTTLIPLYFIDVLKMSNLSAGSFFSVNSAAMILGYYFWGHHIDKKNPLKTRLFVMILLSFMHLCFFVSSWVKTDTVILFGLIGLAYFFQGISTSGGELARINLFTRIVPENMIEKYWAIDFFLLGIRGAIAPFFAIYLKNIIDFKYIFLLSFGLIQISAVLMFLLYKNNFLLLQHRGLE